MDPGGCDRLECSRQAAIGCFPCAQRLNKGCFFINLSLTGSVDYGDINKQCSRKERAGLYPGTRSASLAALASEGEDKLQGRDQKLH